MISFYTRDLILIDLLTRYHKADETSPSRYDIDGHALLVLREGARTPWGSFYLKVEGEEDGAYRLGIWISQPGEDKKIWEVFMQPDRVSLKTLDRVIYWYEEGKLPLPGSTPQEKETPAIGGGFQRAEEVYEQILAEGGMTEETLASLITTTVSRFDKEAQKAIKAWIHYMLTHPPVPPIIPAGHMDNIGDMLEASRTPGTPCRDYLLLEFLTQLSDPQQDYVLSLARGQTATGWRPKEGAFALPGSPK